MTASRARRRRLRGAARRQPRLERRAARAARADAMVQQQRLEAALSHGPYRKIRRLGR
jgi:hypothetical protein